MDRWLALCTLDGLLVRGADRHPDRDAVVLPAQRRTYAQLDRRARDVARSLAAFGVGKGDRVGILMPNSMDFVDTLFGAAYLGAVAVPINARSSARELGYVIANSELSIILTADTADERTSSSALLQLALPDLAEQRDPRALRLSGAPRLRAAVTLGHSPAAGLLTREEFEAAAVQTTAAEVEERRSRVALRDIAIMFYTSGTTAMPKGCPLTHEAIVRTGVTTRRRLGYRAADRLWDPLPMFHTGFMQPLIAMFDAAGTYVTMARFEPGEALALIDREAVTVMFPAFPTIMQALLNHPSYDVDRFSRVRSVFNVGSPEALLAMQARMPHTIQVTGYGMTEFGGSVALSEPTDRPEERAFTQGRPLPGIEVEIRDGVSPRPAECGVLGEIVVRGPSMFAGYHMDEAKNADTIEADGWFHTGDLGTLDAHGRLAYRGRLKDMLKVGGENVAAIEIESYLVTHPAVSIAVVIGVPDARYEEVPVAFVELTPGAVVDAEELIGFCSAGLARFKVPRHVQLVTEWPMSATKIHKHRLREDFLANRASAPSP